MHFGTFKVTGGVPLPDCTEFFLCTEFLWDACCGEGLPPSPCDDTEREELDDDLSARVKSCIRLLTEFVVLLEDVGTARVVCNQMDKTE